MASILPGTLAIPIMAMASGITIMDIIHTFQSMVTSVDPKSATIIGIVQVILATPGILTGLSGSDNGHYPTFNTRYFQVLKEMVQPV